MEFAGQEFTWCGRGLRQPEIVQVVVRPEDIQVALPLFRPADGPGNASFSAGVHYEMHVRQAGYEWIIHSTQASQVGELIGMNIGPDEYPHHARTARRVTADEKTKWTASPSSGMDGGVHRRAAGHRGVFRIHRQSRAFYAGKHHGLGAYTTVFARSIVLASSPRPSALGWPFPVSYLLVFRMRLSKPAHDADTIMLPMWMNFLLRTYAWMSLLGAQWHHQPLSGAVAGHGPFNMIVTPRRGGAGHGVQLPRPYMVPLPDTIMVKSTTASSRAAQDLGANVYHVVGSVLVPLSMPASPRASPWCSCPASPSPPSSAACWAAARTCSSATPIELQFWATATTTIRQRHDLVLMVIVLCAMSFTTADTEEMEAMV